MAIYGSSKGRKKADDPKGVSAMGRRVDESKKWRKDYEDVWREMADAYAGKQWSQSDDQDLATVNVAKSTVDIIFASTTIRAPKMTVLARQPENMETAATIEAVVNYWWRRYDVHDEFRTAFKDSLIYGHGWLKTTYLFDEKAEQVSEEQISEAIETQIMEADMAAEAMPEMAGELPTDEDIIDDIRAIAAEHPNYKVIADHPKVVRVSPFDIFIDPEATSLRDANWIAQRVVRSYDDVKKDTRYRAAARRELRPAAVSLASLERDEFGVDRPRSDDAKRVVLYEYYNLEDNTFCVFAEGADSFLVNATEIPFSFGHPFIQMRNYDVPGKFYPIGEVEPIHNLQGELNETRTQLLNHRKKYAAKYLAMRPFLGPDAQAALRSNRDGEVVFIDDTSMPLDQIIRPMQQVNMQGELYNMTSVIHSDIERVSGVNEYMRGNAPQIRRTATEAAILQDAAAARAADKLEIVEIAAARVGMRMVQLAQEFLTTEQVARIADPNGSTSWITFDRESIQGEYDFEVESGSTMPRSDATQRQDAVNLLQMLSPFIGELVNGQELITMVLRRFGEKEPEKFVMQPEPPMPEQMPDPMAALMGGGGDPMAAMGGGDPMAAMGGGAPPGDIPPELLAALMGGGDSISGVTGAPQAMSLGGTSNAAIGDGLSEEMLAQLAMQMGLEM